MTLIDLLLAYGIAFGLMNKVDFLHGKVALVDRLLKCSYCTGFHAGWLTWTLTLQAHFPATLDAWTLVQPLSWAFASAAFSYGCDTTLQLAESWVRKEQDDE